MTTYNALLTIPDFTTDYTVPFQAGAYTLTCHFIWDTTNEEQYNIIARALENRAKADPLIKDDEVDIERDYEWIDFYTSLPEDINAYLEEGNAYPQSLRGLTRTQQVYQLEQRVEEASELQDLLEMYITQRVWNVWVTDAEGNVQQGTVRPGGWINNTSEEWRLRFVSDLGQIGREDLSKVYVEVEVAE